MSTEQPHSAPTRDCGTSTACGSCRWTKWIAAIFAFAVLLGAVFLVLPDNRARIKLSLQASGDKASAKPGGDSVEQHPLAPALELARKVEKNLTENVRDYTATVLKQERIGQTLQPLEIAKVKIREQPFSAYMKFVSPPNLAGQQALFVENQNDGNLIGRAGSGLRALAGTVQIPPNGPIAMLGQRYPITELGILNLTRRLIEVGENDMKYGQCHVWIDDKVRVGDRPCTSITVMHPEKHSAFIFHIARIFVDNELMAPLHYEAYDWPVEPGGPPVLLERYTYANLELNPGLTDDDFNPRNPQYGLLP